MKKIDFIYVWSTKLSLARRVLKNNNVIVRKIIVLRCENDLRGLKDIEVIYINGYSCEEAALMKRYMERRNIKVKHIQSEES